MSFSPLALAEGIIQAAGREHPADAVLRQKLKSQRDLRSDEAAWISEAVFAYYRWRGWLDVTRPVSEQIQRALTLATKFARQPQSFSDGDMVERAVPAWIHQQMQVPIAWARALQIEPALWLRARPEKGNALARKLGHCSHFGQETLRGILRYNGNADLFRTKEFHAGEFEVQDLSSQAVGLICHPRPGETWWDACAGEGGKLLHLSDLMQNKGLIWASDRVEWRLKKLKRRAARARSFNYRVARWDGARQLPTRTKFDGVLVDAPCRGSEPGNETLMPVGPQPRKTWASSPRFKNNCYSTLLEL